MLRPTEGGSRRRHFQALNLTRPISHSQQNQFPAEAPSALAIRIQVSLKPGNGADVDVRPLPQDFLKQLSLCKPGSPELHKSQG
jgi:hypothetical protein